MNFDIATLEYTYNYLNKMELLGYTPSKIGVSYRNKINNRESNLFFVDKQSFFNYFKSYLEDKSSFRYCKVGDFVLLTKIEFNNTNTSYANSVLINDIKKELTSKKTVDSGRNSDLDSQSNKFKSFIIDSLKTYNKNIGILITIRNSEYVDACYVNHKYVENKYGESFTDETYEQILKKYS